MESHINHCECICGSVDSQSIFFLLTQCPEATLIFIKMQENKYMNKKNHDIFNMTGVTKVIILCIINILFQKVNFVV